MRTGVFLVIAAILVLLALCAVAESSKKPNRKAPGTIPVRKGRKGKAAPKKGKAGQKKPKAKGKLRKGAGAKKAKAAPKTAPPRRTKKMEFAVEGIHAWNSGQTIPLMKQLGVTHIRHDVWMHDVHPCRNEEAQAFRNDLTTVISAARANGITVQLTLGAIASPMGHPTYKGQKCPGMRALGIKPTPAAFGQFVAQQIPYWYSQGVRRFSLYNEPNLPFFLCAGKAEEVKTNFMEDAVKCKGKGSLANAANLYYKLYKAGYGAIRALQKQKAIGNDIEILIGEISSAHAGVKFMDLVLKNGRLVADGMAVHPYQFCTDPRSKARPGKGAPCSRWMPGGIAWLDEWNQGVARWAKSKRLLTSRGKKLPVLVTEFGYLRAPSTTKIPEEFRAKWLPLAFDVANKAGVKQMLQFGVTTSNDPNSWDSGIIDPNGNPLPTYNALKDWAKRNGYKQS